MRPDIKCPCQTQLVKFRILKPTGNLDPGMAVQNVDAPAICPIWAPRVELRRGIGPLTFGTRSAPNAAQSGLSASRATFFQAVT